MENKFLGSTGLARFLENMYEVFSKVGHTHKKSQIEDFPTIPTNTSQLTNDSGFITAEDMDTIIPVDSELSESSENPVQNKALKAQLDAVRGQIAEHLVDEAAHNDIRQMIGEKVFTCPDEPTDAADGDLWIDTDEEDEGSTPVEVDTTLSVEGRAADAKAVGEALDTKQPVGDYALKSEVPSAITGTAGQFVVIGDDGKPTTKTIPVAKESEF